MKKGFTLIELLAVIVILAIIALILVPTINICSSNVYAEKFDISNNVVATVNYASDVVFTNGTNTPRVHNTTGDGIINSNYTGTCTR